MSDKQKPVKGAGETPEEMFKLIKVSVKVKKEETPKNKPGTPPKGSKFFVDY